MCPMRCVLARPTQRLGRVQGKLWHNVPHVIPVGILAPARMPAAAAAAVAAAAAGYQEKRPGKSIDFVHRAAEVDYDAAVLKTSRRSAKLVAKTNGSEDPRLPIRKQTTIC